MLFPMEKKTVQGMCDENILCQPQMKCLPRHLLIDPAIAKDLLVLDIKLGKNSFTGCAGYMPGLLFAEDATFKPNLDLEVCEIGMYLTLTVRNKSPHSIEVSGAWECAVGDEVPVTRYDRKFRAVMEHQGAVIAICTDGTLWKHHHVAGWIPFADKVPLHAR